MKKKVLIRQRFRDERKFAAYRNLISASSYARVIGFAEKLKNKKIAYINSTPNGGGVAELLKNIIPLQRSLGLNVDWYAMEENESFFAISKKLHNSLQGSKLKLTKPEKNFYLAFCKKIAENLHDIKADVVMLQDPQPLGALAFMKSDARIVSRIHIDMTKPNPDSIRFIKPFLASANKLIFTMKQFTPSGLDKNKIIISPPAIDPFADKNKNLTEKQLQAIAEVAGIDRGRPLLVQISRFDSWKDPMGVVQSFRLIQDDYYNAQLALMGLIEAQDDPEAAAVFANVKKYVAGDRNVILISQKSELAGVSTDIFVNGLQRLADVVFQKSIREGFGLTVAEAMWKARPVVGGNVGGIKLQIEDGKNGFLVDSPKGAAKIAVRLISDKRLAKKIGKAAHQKVADDFLISRYLFDELESMISD